MSERKGTVAVRAKISGQVQGVWFRGWTECEAKKLGLFGWVRNRKDGTVEALFIGESAGVDAMLLLCREGPSAATVEQVETGPAKGIAPKRFEVKPTV